MDTKKERYTISCKNLPDELLNGQTGVNHFKKFGRVLKITYRQKLRTCIVEFDSLESATNAATLGKIYKGYIFDIEILNRPEKKTKLSDDDKDLDWPNNPEIQSELDAMGEIVPHQHVFRTKLIFPDKNELGRRSSVFGKSKNINTTVQPPSLIKKKTISALRKKLLQNEKASDTKKPKQKTIDTVLVNELVNIIKSCANNLSDRFKILDARDKLIRIFLNSTTDQDQKIIGTCPDMCPEKERYLRESEHQISIYESLPNDTDQTNRMNHKSAIKQYSRSSADQETPLPHELRPVNVLEMTMNYLLHNIVDKIDESLINEWYHFLWDRTRAIRKDITQQQLCCLGSVQLVEQCARFHIHCEARLIDEEISIFDSKINTENLTKCLQTLKYMYDDLALQGIYCANEAEFRAYIILLNLNNTNIMWEVKHLRPEIQKSKLVLFALKVLLVLDSSNYVNFFKLVRETTYLNACILMRYFNEVRYKALDRMITTYSRRGAATTIPVNELTRLLAFENDESTSTFLQYYGLNIEQDVHVVLMRSMLQRPEMPFEMSRALILVESKLKQRVSELIAGTDELPPKLFENHLLSNSFDANGYLKSSLIDNEWLGSISVKPTIKLPSKDVVDSTKTFTKPIEIKNIFSMGQTVKFDQEPQSKSIFSTPQPPKSAPINQKLPSTQENTNIFQNIQKSNNIFAQTSIFEKKTDPIESKNIFANKPKSIFSNQNIFTPKTDSVEGQKPGNLMFSKQLTTEPSKNQIPTESIYGGFVFPEQKLTETDVKLSKNDFLSDQKVSFMFTSNIVDEQQKKEKELLRIKAEEEEKEREKERERIELERQKAKEEEEAALLEAELRAELLRQIEQKQIEREDRQRKIDVKTLIADLLQLVEQREIAERLTAIKSNLIARCYWMRWRKKVQQMKKRKAVEDLPIWIPKRAYYDEANELVTVNQMLALVNMQQYKYNDQVTLYQDNDVPQIVFDNTYFDAFATTPLNNVFWKIVFSIPNNDESKLYQKKLMNILNNAFTLKRVDENTFLESILVNNSKRVNISIEFVQGCMSEQCLEVVDTVFVGINDRSNINLLRQRFRNVLHSIPYQQNLVLLLRNTRNSFSREEIIDLLELNDKQYELIFDNDNTNRSFVELIEKSLKLLGSCPKYVSRLCMEPMSTFLHSYLGAEFIERIKITMKHNFGLKMALSEPHVTVKLFNEAISLLKNYVFDDKLNDSPDFPIAFNELLAKNVTFPCGYEYFSPDRRQKLYKTVLNSTFDNLILPVFIEAKWPPTNMSELKAILFNYCQMAITSKDCITKIYLNILEFVLDCFEQYENLEFEIKVANLPWLDIFLIIIEYKINDGVDKMADICNKCVFYDKDDVHRYQTIAWWLYSSIIQSNIGNFNQTVDLNLSLLDDDHKKSLQLDRNEFDIDKQLLDMLKYDTQIKYKQIYEKNKREVDDFKCLMNDLDQSIKIQKMAINKFYDIVESQLK